MLNVIKPTLNQYKEIHVVNNQEEDSCIGDTQDTQDETIQGYDNQEEMIYIDYDRDESIEIEQPRRSTRVRNAPDRYGAFNITQYKHSITEHFFYGFR